ncbi:hypothetical protein BU14_0407s0024 [Porphyra umbilicalis]|uniref:Purine permease n=1 Tax=Porphyra umbilicalis TaxID=2786 RepID=A0A1X6NW61_PORUM|nr:hypothetical protein BU14_0407s0024 [Porphyra umbilicalis]|eukprot:OSX72760.1 hypothetical protein BU14_0407s0024 [Porphyra umbilicalis]
MEAPSLPARLRRKVTTRHGWLGDYNYKALCLPRVPFLSPGAPAPFFGLNESLPIAVGALVGFQHALAMIGGITALPLILSGAGDNHLNLDNDFRSYMVSTALITSGLLSLMQIKRLSLRWGGLHIGSGLISLSGPSFTFLPIAEAAIRAMRADGTTCPPPLDGGLPAPCPDAFGRYLGTVAVCCLLEVGLSFLPARATRKVFPPLVTGVTVFLIGASLVGTGLKYWGGGSGPCYAYRLAGGGVPIFAECPNTLVSQTSLPWGHANWIGLGFSVFGAILLIEVFGSPFMRSAQIILALLIGFAVAAATGYVGTASITSAPVVTFLWTRTFNLGFYAPSVIPLLIAFVVTTVESVGDITASCDVSRVETSGPVFESRIQGGILADGVNSLIAVLMTGNPTTTFSQNNAVIAITRCANRMAGYWACFWLILAGILGKVGGVFVAIPDAVVGGMTTFLFANVAVSGIRILARLGWTRRDRFIVSAALAVGLGVSLVPNWFEYIFTYEGDSAGLQAVIDAVKITVSTGYCIGAIIAIALNLLLPFEEEDLTTGSAEAAAPPKSIDSDEEVADANRIDGASSGSS